MLRTEWHVSPAVELQQQLRHLPVAAALQLSVTARQLESQDQFLVLALGSDNLLEVRVPELLEAVPCCMSACPVMLHAVHLASRLHPSLLSTCTKAGTAHTSLLCSGSPQGSCPSAAVSPSLKQDRHHLSACPLQLPVAMQVSVQLQTGLLMLRPAAGLDSDEQTATWIRQASPCCNRA